MDGMMMGMGWMTGFWLLFGLALLTLVVLAIIWFIRNLTSGGSRGIDSAEERLRIRYAAGELSQDEFRQRSADLRGE